jgi:hypothetical protein
MKMKNLMYICIPAIVMVSMVGSQTHLSGDIGEIRTPVERKSVNDLVLVKAEDHEADYPIIQDEAKQERWRTEIDAFAQLFFGSDYALPKDKFVRKPEVTKRVVGQNVRWPIEFRADLVSQAPGLEEYVSGVGHNLALQAPFGPGDSWQELKGLVWVMSASRQVGDSDISWIEMTWGIPPGSRIILDMKIKSVIAVVLGKDLLCVWPDGENARIEYEGPRCDWPHYSEELEKKGFSRLYSYESKKFYRIEVENPNPWNVKVGIRQGQKGRDFIAPPIKTGFTEVPAGAYDIYFQHQVEPEILYQGDRFTVKNAGVKIALSQKEGGNFNIRKVR